MFYLHVALDFGGCSATIQGMTQVLGQAKAMSQLQAAVASGRLHHAWIFHGPKGVGKCTAAVELARLMLCHQPQNDLMGTPQPCETCESCRLFDASSEVDSAQKDADLNPATRVAHPDFHYVTKELARYADDAATRNRKLMNIPTEVLRVALLEPVYRLPQLKHGKVFIVDEAELIGTQGQNLLLKTLEEPPAGTHIILITASEDQLLTTIRSRCQRVAFTPLPDAVIHQWLETHTSDLSPTQRDWLVNFADGSLGRALLAKEYDLLAWSRDVLPGVDACVTGRPPADLGATMANLIDALAKTWVDRHANASKEAANKMASGLMLAMVGLHARRQLTALAAQAPANDPDTAQAMLEPWLHVIESLTLTESALSANVNAGLALDHLVSMMARPGVFHSSVA